LTYRLEQRRRLHESLIWSLAGFSYRRPFSVSFERLRLPPAIGFLVAGLFTKLVLGRTVPDLFSGFNVSGFGYYLLLFSGILIAFRIGREVGVESFDLRAATFVVLEGTAIMVLSLALLKSVGFSDREALSVGISLPSSSTTATYIIAQNLKGEARSVILAALSLEDLLLLTMISLISGSEKNVIVVLTLTIASAFVGGMVFRYLGKFLPRSSYADLLFIAAALAYAGFTESFASPYLGAFIAGYVVQRSTGAKMEESVRSEVLLSIYMFSVGILDRNRYRCLQASAISHSCPRVTIGSSYKILSRVYGLRTNTGRCS